MTVSGQVANAEVTEYLLTVLIKENGLVGAQEDGQAYSFKSGGFKEFVHPCVARDVLCSDALGDEVAVENQAYSKNSFMHFHVLIHCSWNQSLKSVFSIQLP